MIRTGLILGTLVIVASLLVSNSTVAQDKAKPKQAKVDVSGVWENELALPDGQALKYRMKLKQKGAKVTGYLVDPTDKTKKIVVNAGKVKGRTLTFWHKGEYEGREYKASYEGQIRGKKINGQVDVEIGDGGDFMVWKAKRIETKKKSEKK